MILSFPVAALPCCALCGWRTPADGIKDSGKGGCRRFNGFRRSRVSGPGGCWSHPLPNGENLAQRKVSIVRSDACSSLRPADDKRPQFRAWCHRQAIWEPKRQWAQPHVFHVPNRPEGKGRGRPDKSPRADSPPQQPLHFASRCSARMARGTVRHFIGHPRLASPSFSLPAGPCWTAPNSPACQPCLMLSGTHADSSCGGTSFRPRYASPSGNPCASPTVAIWSPLSQKRQK